MSKSRRENQLTAKKKAKAARKLKEKTRQLEFQRAAFRRNAKAAGLPADVYALHRLLG